MKFGSIKTKNSKIQCLIFIPQTFSKREIDYYLWDFGNGKTEKKLLL
jgi:hypothetical protein